MTEMTQQQEVEQPVPLAALFNGFLIVSVCGIGGGSGLVWARRIAVETRRWISDRESPTSSVYASSCPARTLSVSRSASERRCEGLSAP